MLNEEILSYILGDKVVKVYGLLGRDVGSEIELPPHARDNDIVYTYEVPIKGTPLATQVININQLANMCIEKFSEQGFQIIVHENSPLKNTMWVCTVYKNFRYEEDGFDYMFEYSPSLPEAIFDASEWAFKELFEKN